MRKTIALLGGVMLWGGLAAGQVAAQTTAPLDAAQIGALVEGAWHGQIDTPQRPNRYLEVLGIEQSASGRFTASTLFGWADGPISPVQAELTVDGPAVTLSLTATTGAALQVRFAGGAAQGTYAGVGEPARAVRFVRLAERQDYAWLAGVWSALRNGQTRIFDIKRVVGTEDGAIIAIGQYGIVEEPDSVRQMVATVDGEPAKARISWRTGGTAAELRRVKPNELSGSFEVADPSGRKADPIVFRPGAAGALAGARQRPAARIALGRPFPDLGLVTMEGRTVRMSDFRGKTVLLTFYQSWDVWSLDELRSFRAAKARYGDRLVILTVRYAMSGGRPALERNGAAGSGLETYSAQTMPAGLRRIPASWLIDVHGTVVEEINYLPAHRLFALLDQTLR